MIYKGLNRIGMIGDIKTKGGGEIAEVYGGINEANPIYYKTRTLTGTLPLSYKALGKPLTDYLISGKTVQDGTPTPEDPVDVVGCGAWDETRQSYKLPITVNGTEYPIYLGTVPTTRRIKKLVLTGKENWVAFNNLNLLTLNPSPADFRKTTTGAICTHLPLVARADYGTNTFCWSSGSTGELIVNIGDKSLSDLKAYLQQQYSDGTPVTVWYVIATPTTGIVNEPLHKIVDYADTISMAQAGVTIQTVAGTNTLTVDTTVHPSAVSITGNIKEVST